MRPRPLVNTIISTPYLHVTYIWALTSKIGHFINNYKVYMDPILFEDELGALKTTIAIKFGSKRLDNICDVDILEFPSQPSLFLHLEGLLNCSLPYS